MCFVISMPFPTPVILRWILFLVALSSSCSTGYAQGSAPNWGWVQQASSTSSAYPTDMAVDGSGSTYVVGSFSDKLTVGSTTLTSSGIYDNDNFLVKYRADGGVEWVRQFSGLSEAQSGGVVVAPDGDIYITGSFLRQLTIGNVTLTTNGTSVYTARYNAQGVLQWVRQSGVSQTGAGGYGNDIGLDAAGNVYVTGLYAHNIDFGSTSLTPSATNRSAVFLVKYDANGALQWVRQDASNDAAQGYFPSLAVESSGNVYLFCSTAETTTFGTTEYTCRGGIDSYLAKYSPEGNSLWVRQVGGSGSDSMGRGAVDTEGNVYLSNSFTGTADFSGISLHSAGNTDIALVKYTSAGTAVWGQAVGGPDTEYARAAVVDGNGNVYLTGLFTGTATFGANTYASAGHYDALLLSYTTQGLLNWSIATGGYNPDEFTAIGFDDTGLGYVVGRFSTQIPLGTTTLTAASSTGGNWFVGQLATPQLPLYLQTFLPSSGAPGQSVSLTGTGFTAVTDVLFNGTPAASFSVQSAKRLTATVPVGVKPGPLSVRTSTSTSTSAAAFQLTVLATTPSKEEDSLVAWPNPIEAATQLQLNLPATIGSTTTTSIELRNVLGQVVWQAQLKGRTVNLPLPALAPGVYLLSLQPTGQPTIVQRLVVTD
jgi:hypothetical protein